MSQKDYDCDQSWDDFFVLCMEEKHLAITRHQLISMNATPDLSHLSSRDFNVLYEPAEDSFLLMDVLEQDVDAIKAIRPFICLEVGSGSGIISTFLAQLLGCQSLFLCTDINPRASVATQATGQKNNVCLNPVICDLVLPLVQRLSKAVDVLLFNPPYVVTPSEEIAGHGLEASWAGGIKGREVMDRFFPYVPQLLSDHGMFYLVTVKENDIDDIGIVLKNLGLDMDTVLSRRAGAERLTVLKFTRTKVN